MKVIVFGSTGSIGRRVVHYLVKDQRVSGVAAVSRGTPKEPDFFSLDSSADPVTKLSQVQVNFSNLDSEQAKFNGFDAGVSCIGVYSSAVKNVEEFMRSEFEPNMKVATLCAAGGAKRWAYLSGNGAKQPTDGQTKPAFMQANFSFVKGSTELGLSKVPGFVATCAVRPAMILGRVGEPVYGAFDRLANRMSGFLSARSLAIMADDIAKGMVNSLFVNTGTLNEILENQDIKARAGLAP